MTAAIRLVFVMFGERVGVERHRVGGPDTTGRWPATRNPCRRAWLTNLASAARGP